jgi:hypothetical protein
MARPRKRPASAVAIDTYDGLTPMSVPSPTTS